MNINHISVNPNTTEEIYKQGNNDTLRVEKEIIIIKDTLDETYYNYIQEV